MKGDVIQQIGAVVRQVRDAEHDGKPTKVVSASRTYSTDPADLWDAITNPERLERWFSPVTGELRLGGRYRLKNSKVSGTITECQPPKALAFTWEHFGTSWVTVRLVSESSGRTSLHLEHMWRIPPRWVRRWTQKYWDNPGSGGVGWDISLIGLDKFLTEGRWEEASWCKSQEGNAFMRSCAEDWGRADIAAGADAAKARAMVQRNIAFYAGEKGAGGAGKEC